MRAQLRLVAVSCAALLLLPAAAGGVPIEVEYGDSPGQGFFDAGLGEKRRTAFEHAVGLWERMLAGEVPIRVFAAIESAGGTGTSALLASAGSVTFTVPSSAACRAPGTRRRWRISSPAAT